MRHEHQKANLRTLNFKDNLFDDLPCGHRQDRSPVQMTDALIVLEFQHGVPALCLTHRALLAPTHPMVNTS